MTSLRVLQAGPIVILVLLAAAMALLSPYFLTGRNMTNLGFQAAFVAVLALGQLLVIITRGIDLSVGSVVGLAGVLAVGAGGGVSTLLVFALTGLAVGLANGSVLVFGRVMNPFIVTLGTLGIVRGLALVVSDGQTQTGLDPVVTALGSGTVAGIPAPVIVVAALSLAIGGMLSADAVGPLDLCGRRQSGRRPPRRDPG